MITYGNTVKDSKVLTAVEKDFLYHKFFGEKANFDFESFDVLRETMVFYIEMFQEDHPNMLTTSDVEDFITECYEVRRGLMLIDKLQKEAEGA